MRRFVSKFIACVLSRCRSAPCRTSRVPPTTPTCGGTRPNPAGDCRRRSRGTRCSSRSTSSAPTAADVVQRSDVRNDARGAGVHRRPVPGDGTLLRRGIRAAGREPHSRHGDVPGDVADDGNGHLLGRRRHGHEVGRSGSRSPTHNLSGTYIGSFLSLQHGCANPVSNGPFNGSGPVHDRAQSVCPRGHDHRHPDRQPGQLHVHVSGHVQPARQDRQHRRDLSVQQRACRDVECERDRGVDARRHPRPLLGDERRGGLSDHRRLRRSQAPHCAAPRGRRDRLARPAQLRPCRHRRRARRRSDRVRAGRPRGTPRRARRGRHRVPRVTRQFRPRCGCSRRARACLRTARGRCGPRMRGRGSQRDLPKRTGIDVRLEQRGGLSVFLSERERRLARRADAAHAGAAGHAAIRLATSRPARAARTHSRHRAARGRAPCIATTTVTSIR